GTCAEPLFSSQLSGNAKTTRMGNTHGIGSDDLSRLKADGSQLRSFKATVIESSPGLLNDSKYHPASNIAAADEHGDEGGGDTENDSGLLNVLGSSGGRPILIVMAGKEVLLRESDGYGMHRTLTLVGWSQILQFVWDHSQSAVKVSGRMAYSDRGHNDPAAEMFAIFTVNNSLELETEIKSRIRAEAKRLSSNGVSPTMPEFVYIGMFAGSSKPKPFQRKRANLSSTVPANELPPLTLMRRWAIDAHAGSWRPLPQGTSMRAEAALELVYSGENRFA
ncbi:unnamed protein product, partial [Phaeothamnion confervicola]